MDISTAMMACNADPRRAGGARAHRGRAGRRGRAVRQRGADDRLCVDAAIVHRRGSAAPRQHQPGHLSLGRLPGQRKPFYINCGNDKIFQRLMSKVIDRPDLARSDRYATGTAAYAAAKNCLRSSEMRSRSIPGRTGNRGCAPRGVPCGKVRTVGEAIRSPEARERGIVTRIPHATLGWVPNMRLPIRYSQHADGRPVAAPAVGQHTGAGAA